MAAIEAVDLKIFTNNPTAGEALVQVSYQIRATGDDLDAATRYAERVQLFSGRQPIQGDPLSDGIVVFDGGHVGFQRLPERTMPLASLTPGGPLGSVQSDPVIARVTLTPLAPSRDSNSVTVQAPLVVA
jgi:hypothetical protein